MHSLSSAKKAQGKNKSRQEQIKARTNQGKNKGNLMALKVLGGYDHKQ